MNATTPQTDSLCAEISRDVAFDRTKAYCLAEVILNTTLHGKLTTPIADLVKVLLDDPADNSQLSEDDLALKIMSKADEATTEIVDALMTSADFAFVMAQSACAVKELNFWGKEDFTFDCMVLLGLQPKYEDYQEPSLLDWEDSN